MSIETGKLGDIYREIQSEFDNDAEIQVTPISGEPASEYEVTFSIPSAVKDDDGQITLSSSHTVLISIPFGFPHFPPSCRPKSSIFHPDFDSAAVCLGDFWDSSLSITDLIRHLQKMISGEIYSTENAFNDEALTWYLENSDKLPFSPIGQEQAEPSPPESTLTLESLTTEEESQQEDDDFFEDFDFDEVAEQENLSSVPDASATSKHNIDSLLQLARESRFQQLNRELTTVYRHTSFAEKDELMGQAVEALTQARKYHEEAENFENSGQADKALNSYKLVQQTVADFEHIDNDIKRLEQSAELLEELAGFQKPSPSDTQQATHDAEEQLSTPLEPEEDQLNDSRDSEKLKKQKRKLFEDSPRKQFNIIPFVVAGGVFCVIATFTYFYFSLSSQLTEARQHFSDCTQSFAAKSFQAAEKSCSTAMDMTRTIFLIHQSEVDELQGSIRKILNSEEMRQGLLGNVLYNEKYVSKSTLAAHQSLQELRQEGEMFLKENAWDEAAASFQKALEISRRLQGIQPEELVDTEQKFRYSAFRSMLVVAEKHIANEDWESAYPILTELQDQVNALPPEHQTAYSSQIATMLARGRFSDLKDQADKLFSESDWTGAVTLFQKAAEAGHALSEKEHSQLEDIQQNIARAELYATINEGNTAFAKGDWDMAISRYEKAIELLNDKSKVLNIPEVDLKTTRLKSIILQSAIIRDRQIAEANKDDGDSQAALASFDKVIETITTSEFAANAEFQEILSETKDAREKLVEELFIDSKKQYLVDNYKELFIRNYPAATQESLSSPVATFEKKVGEKLLFKLQSTESGRGRPLKLVMFYQYDPADDSWSFTSNQ